MRIPNQKHFQSQKMFGGAFWSNEAIPWAWLEWGLSSCWIPVPPANQPWVFRQQLLLSWVWSTHCCVGPTIVEYGKISTTAVVPTELVQWWSSLLNMGRIPQGEEQCSAFLVSSCSPKSLSCIYITLHYTLLITCGSTVESFFVTREYASASQSQ